MEEMDRVEGEDYHVTIQKSRYTHFNRWLLSFFRYSTTAHHQKKEQDHANNSKTAEENNPLMHKKEEEEEDEVNITNWIRKMKTWWTRANVHPTDYQHVALQLSNDRKGAVIEQLLYHTFKTCLAEDVSDSYDHHLMLLIMNGTGRGEIRTQFDLNVLKLQTEIIARDLKKTGLIERNALKNILVDMLPLLKSSQILLLLQRAHGFVTDSSATTDSSIDSSIDSSSTALSLTSAANSTTTTGSTNNSTTNSIHNSSIGTIHNSSVDGTIEVGAATGAVSNVVEGPSSVSKTMKNLNSDRDSSSSYSSNEEDTDDEDTITTNNNTTNNSNDTTSNTIHHHHHHHHSNEKSANDSIPYGQFFEKDACYTSSFLKLLYHYYISSCLTFTSELTVGLEKYATVPVQGPQKGQRVISIRNIAKTMEMIDSLRSGKGTNQSGK